MEDEDTFANSTPPALRGEMAPTFGKAVNWSAAGEEDPGPAGDASQLDPDAPYFMVTPEGVFARLVSGQGERREVTLLPRPPRSGIYWVHRDKKLAVPRRLTNFAAEIVGERILDDGEQQRWEFVVRAWMEGERREFHIPAEQFDGLQWVTAQLGATAILYPVTGGRRHVPVAIRSLSEPERRLAYTHTGWRQIRGCWAFVHAGGALGANGAVPGIEVELPDQLRQYRLPNPGDRETTRKAIRASLATCTIVPGRAVLMLAAVYTAVLGEVLENNFMLWVQGNTGQRKSTMAALQLAHFGGNGSHQSIPTSFDSTANALLDLSFLAKDVLLPVDDFNASSDEREALRLIYAVGNQQGRQRLGEEDRPPRCIGLVTAELPPPGGASAEARTLNIPWPWNAIALDQLTRAQEADVELYPLAMAAYLQWMAPRIDSLRDELPKQLRRHSHALANQGISHGRLAEIASKLVLGFQLFLSFACEVGAVTLRQQADMMEEIRSAVIECARSTTQRQEERSPVSVFRTGLQALLSQGQIAIAAACHLTGQMTKEAQWVGWRDDNTGRLYLFPDDAFNATRRWARNTGHPFPGRQRDLAAALDQEGWLIQKDKGHHSTLHRVGPRRERVWTLPSSFLTATAADESEELPVSKP